MLARAISAHFGNLHLGVLEFVQIPFPHPAKYMREHHSQREKKLSHVTLCNRSQRAIAVVFCADGICRFDIRITQCALHLILLRSFG